MKRVTGKKIGIFGIAFCMAAGSGACALLPQEETYRAAPVVSAFQGESYKTAVVDKGGVELSAKIYCEYVSAAEEHLGFAVAGEILQNIYCKAGQVVKAGTLLVELEMNGLPEESAELEKKISYQKLLISQTKELRALEKERQELLLTGQDMDRTEKSAAVLAALLGYDNQLEEYEDELYLLQRKLEAAEQKMEARRLTAPIDGTVSYVRKKKEGDETVADETLVTIVSGESCYFKVESEHVPLMQPEDKILVESASAEYETTVEIPEGQESVAYLVLEDTAIQPEVGSRGSFVFQLGVRQDVLRIPNEAVRKRGEESVVYYEDESGIKNAKEVQVGLKGNTMTELLGGLDFGDTVIIK